MTYDASTVVYDGNEIDRETVFIHSATEAEFARAGRIEYRREQDSPRSPFFVAHDSEFPGKRIYVHDGLEPGRVFTRTSPPAVTYGDFRFVYGEYDEKAGTPTVAVYLDKMDVGKVFECRDYSEERMLDFFRRDLSWKHSQYTPV